MRRSKAHSVHFVSEDGDSTALENKSQYSTHIKAVQKDKSAKEVDDFKDLGIITKGALGPYRRIQLRLLDVTELDKMAHG